MKINEKSIDSEDEKEKRQQTNTQQNKIISHTNNYISFLLIYIFCTLLLLLLLEKWINMLLSQTETVTPIPYVCALHRKSVHTL